MNKTEALDSPMTSRQTISLDTTTYNRIAHYAKVVGKTPEQVTANALNEWMEEWGEEVLLMFAKASKKQARSTKVTSRKKADPTCITSGTRPAKPHKTEEFTPAQQVGACGTYDRACP